jgi:hypothetical protein
MVNEPSQATEYNPWKSGEPASMWSALSAQSFDTTGTIQEVDALGVFGVVVTVFAWFSVNKLDNSLLLN